MLDLMLLKYIASKRETFRDAAVDNSYSAVFLVMLIVWSVVIGIPAAYFSWTSNTLIGWDPVAKVFFSFFAFLSGLQYILIHVINKLDLIYFIQNPKFFGFFK
jgi:hypothetical protein